jgi:hypothetical protein
MKNIYKCLLERHENCEGANLSTKSIYKSKKNKQKNPQKTSDYFTLKEKMTVVNSVNQIKTTLVWDLRELPSCTHCRPEKTIFYKVYTVMDYLYQQFCYFQWIRNRKSIETRGYLICTKGRSPRVLIRLSSVLMIFLFCIIVQHKNTFPVVTIWNPGKKEPMNEHLNMIFLSLSFSLPSQYVNPSKNQPINGHALECG